MTRNFFVLGLQRPFLVMVVSMVFSVPRCETFSVARPLTTREKAVDNALFCAHENVVPIGRDDHVQSLVGQDSSQGDRCRRGFLTTLMTTTTSAVMILPVTSTWALDNAAVPSAGRVTVTLQSPGDRLGIELCEVDIGSGPSRRHVVAIKSVPPNVAIQTNLVPGLIWQDDTSMTALQTRIQKGPYPLQLTFYNLAAGGDALAETGVPLVSAQDALQLAQSSPSPTATSSSPPSSSLATAAVDKGNKDKGDDVSGYRIDIVGGSKPLCKIQSRRNDVLEINYVAKYQSSSTSPSWIIYDASEQRGTGQPYQMVLGSGDMVPGVDLGLYDMCPGEQRVLTIPPRLGYGRNGNRLYRVPPDQTLVWEVELVRINGVVGVGEDRTRDDMEERVPY